MHMMDPITLINHGIDATYWMKNGCWYGFPWWDAFGWFHPKAMYC